MYLVNAGKTVAAGATYVGPGDIASGAFAWGGLRAYNAAYAAVTGALVDLVDQAGANPTTINCLTTGQFDTSAYNAWVTAHSVTTAHVAKLYDQTGNGRHFVQTGSTGNKPPLAASGPTGQIVMVGDVTNTAFLQGNANITLAQPFTTFAVVQMDATLTGRFAYFGATDGSMFAGYRGVGSLQANYSFGTEVDGPSITGSSWRAHGVLASGASSFNTIDGSSSSPATGGTGAFPGTSAIALFGDFVTGVWPTGLGYAEFGIWSGDQSAHFSTLNSNAHGSANGWNF